MAALPMDAQPGERLVYGYNADILGVVVEKVSGRTLAEFVEKRITGPLGLVDTQFYLPRRRSASPPCTPRSSRACACWARRRSSSWP
jgi:CubicO group peptidase (beta-lactamase class C family)